jgi:hypothetical protein
MRSREGSGIECNEYTRRLEMTGPIYKFWRMKWRDAWYRLSKEEQDDHMAKLGEIYEKVGAKLLVMCDVSWSSEPYQVFGVDEFPNIEAVLETHRILNELGHWQYSEEESMLGTKWEPS